MNAALSIDDMLLRVSAGCFLMVLIYRSLSCVSHVCCVQRERSGRDANIVFQNTKLCNHCFVVANAGEFFVSCVQLPVAIMLFVGNVFCISPESVGRIIFAVFCAERRRYDVRLVVSFHQTFASLASTHEVVVAGTTPLACAYAVHRLSMHMQTAPAHIFLVISMVLYT